MERHPDAEVIAGRYGLGSRIGQGSIAEVYEGEDQLLTRPVAVKLMLASLAGQPDSRSRFEDEARVAARLSDPNVVAIYDTGDHAGRPFIVMELLPGRTLQDELGDGPMSEERAVTLISQVLHGLRAAHDRGVIHRDLKPANVLLTESGDAKVADFGIAKGAASASLTATGLVLGTPAYLAPECVVGGAATIESDLYAVGVILYEALAGRAPFVADTPLAVCHAVCHDEAPPLRDLRPGVGEPLTAVVARAMAKDPQARFHSANAMLRGLDFATEAVPVFIAEPVLGPEAEPTIETPVVAPLPAGAALLPRTDPHRQSRRRTLIVGSVVALAVLAGAIGVATMRSHNADTSTDTKPATSAPTTVSSALTTAPTTSPSDGNTAPVTVPVTTAPVVTSPSSTTPSTVPSSTTPPSTIAPTTAPPSTAPPSTTPPTS